MEKKVKIQSRLVNLKNKKQSKKFMLRKIEEQVQGHLGGLVD